MTQQLTLRISFEMTYQKAYQIEENVEHKWNLNISLIFFKKCSFLYLLAKTQVRF